MTLKNQKFDNVGFRAKRCNQASLLNERNLQIVRDVRDTYVNREHPPASTLVVVKQLFRTELLVEVDAIAVADD